MWDGLTRIVITPTKVTLQFRGRSEGQQPSRGRKKGSAGTVRINNALKGATVLSAHGVNVLALSESEFGAIGIGCISSVALGIGGSFEVQWGSGRARGNTVEAVMRDAFGASGPALPTGAL
jgi:hypothetical protein